MCNLFLVPLSLDSGRTFAPISPSVCFHWPFFSWFLVDWDLNMFCSWACYIGQVTFVYSMNSGKNDRIRKYSKQFFFNLVLLFTAIFVIVRLFSKKISFLDFFNWFQTDYHSPQNTSFLWLFFSKYLAKLNKMILEWKQSDTRK